LELGGRGEDVPLPDMGGVGFPILNTYAITYLLTGIAIIVLAFIIVRVYLLYRPHLSLRRMDEDETSSPGFEDLSPAGHLAMADRYIREGRFSEALSTLMMALLLALDAERLIRYHRSRTNHEYLTHLKPHPILYSVAGEFVHHFEQMKYGRRPPDSEGLAYLLDLYGQVEKALPAIPSETVTA
jgi:hypothetical protein